MEVVGDALFFVPDEFGGHVYSLEKSDDPAIKGAAFERNKGDSGTTEGKEDNEWPFDDKQGNGDVGKNSQQNAPG